MREGVLEVMLTNAQIGRCGELLVQCQLLKFGIESAQMTTDAGVDLVAYAGKGSRAWTIQVKTKSRPTPAGGRGRPLLNWWHRADSPAELVALVELERDRAWLFRHQEIVALAQQAAGGKVQLYFYPEAHPLGWRRSVRLADEFEGYLLSSSRVLEIFGIDASSRPLLTERLSTVDPKQECRVELHD